MMRSPRKERLTAKSPLILGIVQFLLITTKLGLGTPLTPNFVRDVSNGATLADAAGVPFVVNTVMSFDEALSVAGVYQHVEGRDPVILHGKKESDGKFWPKASLQVATEGNSKWKTVDQFEDNSTSATVDLGNPRIIVYVNLEPLRREIGTYRWGRIVLENGDSALIELDDLLPTKESRDAAGNYKEIIKQDFDVSPLGASAYLYSVTCIAQRLTGDFLYFGVSEGFDVTKDGSATTLKGMDTPEGDFWPDAQLEVGNSDRNWQKIGESHHEGRSTEIEIAGKKQATILRVALDSFRVSASKFKYGKIIFSNGQFALFELKHLESNSTSVTE